ncbi:MAG: rhodanese-like domain-containing protein [Nitrospirota bacterium]
METPQKPKISPPCKQCHQPDEKILRGTLIKASEAAQTMQVQVGSATWLVKFDDDTKVTGAWAVEVIPKEKEISVTLGEKNKELYAVSVAVKPPAKVRNEQLIKTDEVAKLVALGPEKGKFLLIDTRPAPKFGEGHIPGAINIYDVEFDKHSDKLPRDKDFLIIYYCAGPT